MKPMLRLGLGWKCIKIIDEVIKDRRIDYGNGVSELYKDQICYIAECDCGNKIDIWPGDWKGYKHVPDCGCGIAARLGGSAIATITMKIALREKIRRYALKNGGLSFSRAVIELVKKGLEAGIR